MWVEISLVFTSLSNLSSSSSWGCELKYIHARMRKRRLRHPLREDVSWNMFLETQIVLQSVILFVRMWVEICFWNLPPSLPGVILFVRMWVEISFSRYAVPTQPVILFVRMWVEITEQENASVEQRHPLREDVSWNNVYDDLKQKLMGHPLREDVSWNTASALFLLPPFVILFVRMWVEMYGYKARPSEHWSSSSWGCELKCKRYI